MKPSAIKNLPTFKRFEMIVSEIKYHLTKFEKSFFIAKANHKRHEADGKLENHTSVKAFYRPPVNRTILLDQKITRLIHLLFKLFEHVRFKKKIEPKWMVLSGETEMKS
ncbi:MAG: hypothetical protein ABJF11_10585 [Reichenbachiella sp.]|uniref:hypothetical protein n=1 Tax=Reichenbachiella sp. TaxID=2184521 RepID=UPI00326481B2